MEPPERGGRDQGGSHREDHPGLFPFLSLPGEEKTGVAFSVLLEPLPDQGLASALGLTLPR